ncbi:MAG: DUF721 domain-containing protein [Gammaproteobacteria bacterium]|nr:DUF721 domain-containing protein [Gammaproteobacteria bacterium]
MSQKWNKPERLKTPTAVRNILQKSDGTFAALIQKARMLRDMQSIVLAMLPSPLREHTWVMNFKEGILTLATDNAVWTSRLKFLVADLVFLLCTEGNLSIKSIECKVAMRPPV